MAVIIRDKNMEIIAGLQRTNKARTDVRFFKIK